MGIDAIVGHTGFVGGILLRQHDFAARFNSSNIHELGGEPFDTLVCAAAPGSMFTANREPERDREQVNALVSSLDRARTRRLVLISSIAVLADFAGEDDEDTQDFQQELAYGRHRRELEAFCQSRFDDCLVVRLPALFGPGLRKNFLFDLLNPVPTMLAQPRLEELLQQVQPRLREALAARYALNAAGMMVLDRAGLNGDPLRLELDDAVRAAGMSATQFHNPDTTYQYYDMSRLWQDIGVASRAGLGTLHLAVEPLRAGDIHARLLGTDMPRTSARLHREDMHTRHAALWHRTGPYLEDAGTVLDKLSRFFASEKHGQ